MTVDELIEKLKHTPFRGGGVVKILNGDREVPPCIFVNRNGNPEHEGCFILVPNPVPPYRDN